VGRRRGSDPVLLWPWRRPAATAPIRPPAWESPYAAGVALEKAKKKKKKKKEVHGNSPYLTESASSRMGKISQALCKTTEVCFYIINCLPGKKEVQTVLNLF